MTQDFSEQPTLDGVGDDHTRDMPASTKEEVKIDGKEIVAEESEISIADAVIKTGADAAQHLLPLRDDFDPVISLRSIVLASAVSGFQAVMNQIYSFKPTSVDISGTFIVLISYFLGNAWAKFLPRGDKFETRWREKHGPAKLPWWISALKVMNNGPWSLKEHSICAITATSASNAAVTSSVFAAQNLFYDMPLSALTYYLNWTFWLWDLRDYAAYRCLARGICVLEYLPTVKTLQGLHWQEVKYSKPLRFFWYAFSSMTIYEFLPAYIFPWLNSVSIPSWSCLAAQKATGSKAAVLTNHFGGATNNEGLGLFSLCLDLQFITSSQTSMPLKFQLHQAVGVFTCFIIMLAIYYGNGWGAKSQPFMSTVFHTAEGKRYPTSKLFPGDWCSNFWGKEVRQAYKSAKEGRYDDRHHQHMAAHYKETSWWWYVLVLIGSFVLGLVVVLRENVTLPAWAYVVALLVGSIISPFSTVLFARYGNGIATNNISKMIAGLTVPGRPVGNMYFAAWSHNVIQNAVNLSNDLKLWEYLKIPPRALFLTQIYGTILSGFINYAIMISIIAGNRALLAEGNGNSSWSGATLQAYNTNAASWALAPYLYKIGSKYEIVPLGLLVGAGVVSPHRLFYYFIPKISRLDISEINMPQFLQYAGYIPYNQSQTCVLFSQILGGFYVQWYLRNYRPRIFKDYSYLITGAFDGASLTVLFILSFAVFGAGGPSHPFPAWWGNNIKGNYDWCSVADE
ncbi:OPT oligopeptide transporter [Penicillium cataractarum]|uniref:OPT oligopeptide transporter n=1 Tax=Penicillium cataractarum TaxID=2100454 RepID=A0A9W9V367_9EURO|nr:OPT oligopeptide transporter [Penicillium cataractarum]KAJ5364810.1 OPT oligopeptide transporter [Penicillium cataractarum]